MGCAGQLKGAFHVRWISANGTEVESAWSAGKPLAQPADLQSGWAAWLRPVS